jgi:hypothetical protein
MSRLALELPDAWRPFAIATDGARAEQRALAEAWCAEHVSDGRPSPPGLGPVVDRMVRESRRAARARVPFAAVLLGLMDTTSDAVQLLVTGSLTVSFRQLPGATDPVVAAEGTLHSLREAADGSPTRRLELVGLGRDSGRPAVLLRDQCLDPDDPDDPAARLSLTHILWLVPGTSQLASVAVATPHRDLAAPFTELALSAASSLTLA